VQSLERRQPAAVRNVEGHNPESLHASRNLGGPADGSKPGRTQPVHTAGRKWGDRRSAAQQNEPATPRSILLSSRMVKHRMCFSRILFWLGPRLATKLDGSIWPYANLSWVEAPRRLRRLKQPLVTIRVCLFNKGHVPDTAAYDSPG
jgi:hypothetical protein